MWSNVRQTIKCRMRPLPIQREWFTPKKASGKYDRYMWIMSHCKAIGRDKRVRNLITVSYLVQRILYVFCESDEGTFEKVKVTLVFGAEKIKTWYSVYSVEWNPGPHSRQGWSNNVQPLTIKFIYTVNSPLTPQPPQPAIPGWRRVCTVVHQLD